jgi:hypothetical protein
MKIFLVATAFLFSTSLFSQNHSEDCLSPVATGSYGNLKHFDRQIDDILFSQLSNFQILIYQHSKKLWAVEIDSLSSDGSQFIITHLSTSEDIRHLEKDIKEVNVNRVSKIITKDELTPISQLFSAALNSVCASCHNVGLDGTYYRLSNGLITGQVWSPPQKSKRGRLINICQEIDQLLSNTKGINFEVPKKLKSDIILLTHDFKQHNLNHH